MNKRLVIVLVVLGLFLLGLTATRWAPALLGFVSDNSDVIQGLTDLVQLLLWAGAAVVALWSIVRGRRAGKAAVSVPQSTALNTGTGAIAQGGSKAGGAQSIVAEQVTNSALAPGGVAIKADTYVENQYLPDPEAMRRKEARERYLRRLRQRCNVLPLAAVGGDEDAGEEVTLDKVYVVLDTETRVPVEGDDKSRGRSGARRTLRRWVAAARTGR